MAKIVKDTRETLDIDTELDKLKREDKKRKTTKEVKKGNKPKSEKKEKKVKKQGLLGEVRSEMKKVKWPSRKDMVKYSISTIIFIIFFALFFYLIDLILALLKAGV